MSNTLGVSKTIVVENEVVFAVVEYRNFGDPDSRELYNILEVAEEQNIFSDWEEHLDVDGGPGGEHFYVGTVMFDFVEFPEFKSMTHEEAKVEITNRLSKVLDGIEVRFVGSE